MAKKFQVVTRSTPMLEAADVYSPLTSEILYGEVVETIAHSGDFLKCRNLTDGYEGFVTKDALSDEIIEPTHKIIRLHSNIYAEPEFKTVPITHLAFLSGVSLSGEVENGFAEIEGGGWIWNDDLTPIDFKAAMPLKTAMMFSGMPYLWGGKTSRGLDCSALVQLALQHSGISCPRDSGDQEKAKLGKGIPFEKESVPDGLTSGDLVFFKGHVGIMLDDTNILNATSRTMDVRVEALGDIIPLYDGGITAVRRL
jgi:cell wall-associated NlpC family hydrolase